MKKIIAASITALMVVLLSACGDTKIVVEPTDIPTASEKSPEPVQEPTPEPTTRAGENVPGFTRFLSTTVPMIQGAKVEDLETELIELGRVVCEELEGGFPVSTVVETMLANGLTEEETSAIIAASVVYLCPDMRAPVQDELDHGTGV